MQCTQLGYKKPIILITLHRRYHELIDNVQHIYRCRIFFKTAPIIYVIWADPEISKKWILYDLKKKNFIHNIIYRAKVDKQGNTSFYESININMALPIIFKRHGDNCFVMVHATDTKVSPVVYNTFEKQINLGYWCSVYSWSRGTIEAWKTAVFAITNKKQIWPPLLENTCPDILESAWVKIIKSEDKKMIKVNSYSDSILFESNCTTETSRRFQDKPQFHQTMFFMSITGYVPLYKRILNWFGVLFKRGEL